jgi:RHS repeat-associated protein
MVKGNLCTKPLRTSECDDENRLTAVTLEEDWRTTFVHDGVGRLRQRQERTWQFVDPPGIYVWGAQAGVYCVYDDKRVIQERDAASTPTVSYTRGLDLSGGLQGAGGIGGLLALSQLSTPDSQHFYYHSDGNGNVTCLITTNQLIAAGYLYDPFGNTLSISGPRAFVNRYRFSSKPAHDVSAACDFLYRWYVPALQKWSNRDPLGEAGAKNLHAFAYNNPLSQLDPMGLSSEIGLPAEVLAEAEAGISPEQIAQDFNIALTRVLAIIAASAAAKAVQEVVNNAQRNAKGKDPCEKAKDAVRQVGKGIESLERVIQKHQGWINDPTSYPGGGVAPGGPRIPRWINDWLGDIAKAQGNIEKSKNALEILEKAVDAACKCWYKPWTWF